MLLKKNLVIFSIILVFLLPLVTAELKIEKKAIVDTVIPELDNSAKFEFTITNLGNDDNFLIYSLVGIDFYPNESFFLKKGDTTKIEYLLKPNPELMKLPGTKNFVYKIKSSNNIQDDVLTMKIINLKDAIDINSYNINLDSDTALIYAKSLVGYDFSEIKANFKSDFFNFEQTFPLKGYETREFQVALNKEETRKLIAGSYPITTNIEVAGVKETIKKTFMFTEKANIRTEDDTSGIIVRTRTVQKINEGNVPTVVQVKITKNILSRLFTTFNQESSSERSGFYVYYIFQKQIAPAENYTVKATTNWLYPLLLVLALILIGYLINKYTTNDIILRKRTSFVKSKGGEFALKITITVKAKKYVENIRIVDRLPYMAKLFPHFTIKPSKIDEHTNRIEWNLSSLQQYEERTLTYVIYSKIGILGRYELPQAVAFFDREGKLQEVTSNRVYFLTDIPRKEEMNI